MSFEVVKKDGFSNSLQDLVRLDIDSQPKLKTLQYMSFFSYRCFSALINNRFSPMTPILPLAPQPPIPKLLVQSGNVYMPLISSFSELFFILSDLHFFLYSHRGSGLWSRLCQRRSFKKRVYRWLGATIDCSWRCDSLHRHESADEVIPLCPCVLIYVDLYYIIRFDNNCTVPEALETIKRVLQPIVIPNFENMTLFAIRSGLWLSVNNWLHNIYEKQALMLVGNRDWREKRVFHCIIFTPHYVLPFLFTHIMFTTEH